MPSCNPTPNIKAMSLIDLGRGVCVSYVCVCTGVLYQGGLSWAPSLKRAGQLRSRKG